MKVASFRLLPLLSLAGVLAGCAAFPDSVDKLPVRSEVTSEMESKWASLPAVQYVRAETGKSVRKRAPLPSSVAQMPLKFSLSAKATLAELVSAIELQRVRVVLKASEEKRNETVQMTAFNGTVAEFLDSFALVHDLDYEFIDGVLLVRQGVRYMVTVPQNRELMERIPVAMGGLGATNIKADIDSGLVTYDATSTVSRDVDLYLQRMAANASMVALQIAVIDVRLNRDAGHGFDWNEFSAKWGSGIDKPVATGVNIPVTPQGVGAAAAAVVTQRVLGSVASLTGGASG